MHVSPRRKARFLLFLPYIMFAAVLCGPACEPDKTPAKGQALLFTDDLGTKMRLKPGEGKVMGLCPSLTEMLYAVVPDSQICAVTDVCNYPARVAQKTRLKVFPLDIEGVLMLKPALVFTEEGITAPENAEKLRSLGIPVYYQRYNTVADVIERIRDIGSLTDCHLRANHLADSLSQEEAELRQAANRVTNKPKVLVLTWKNPIYAHGYNTLMTDKLALAGATNVLNSKLGKMYPELSREYLLKLDPDIIFGGTFAEMERDFFTLYPELKKLKAYRLRRIFPLTDDLASRPGPRVLEGVREMKSLIQKAGY